MDCEPRGNYILCEIEPIKFPNGLEVAEADETGKPRKFATLKVISVGPGKLRDDGSRIPIPYHAGDSVIVHNLAYKAGRIHPLSPLLFNKRDLILVDAGDVIGLMSGRVEMPIHTATPRQTAVLAHWGKHNARQVL